MRLATTVRSLRGQLRRLAPDKSAFIGGVHGMQAHRLVQGKAYEHKPEGPDGPWRTYLHEIPDERWMVEGKILSLEEAASTIRDWIVVKLVMIR